MRANPLLKVKVRSMPLNLKLRRTTIRLTLRMEMMELSLIVMRMAVVAISRTTWLSSQSRSIRIFSGKKFSK